MTEKVKWLDSGPRFEKIFVSVSPFLETFNILVLIRFAPQEVFFVILLLAEMRTAVT